MKILMLLLNGDYKTNNQLVLPAGKLGITLKPYSNSDYQYFMVESEGVNKVAETGFKARVTQMKFYPYIVEGMPKITKSLNYNINKMRVYSHTIDTNNLQQFAFDIEKKTHSITVFFQDGEANQANTLYSKSKFKIRNNADLNLLRLSVQYGNLILPIDQSDFEFVGNQDFSTKWYNESLVLCNSSNDDTIEPIETWQKCGAYYYFKVPHKVEAEELIVSTQFSEPFGVGENRYTPHIYVIVEYNETINIEPTNYDNAKVSVK
jgi:hypothetical protein